MFKFKGISSTDMQVVIEEEEHFIARAAQRYETIEIEGRNGAIFNELGYSYVERPIYVQCLNINKIDQILAWLNGEGEFEYKGRKTIARFYSQLDPQRDTCIRIIDTTFIRDPFWNKVNEEYQTVKDSKIKTITGNPIHITDSSNMPLSFKLNGGSRQESRSGSNLYNLNDTQSVSSLGVEVDEDDFITLSSDNTEGTSTQFINYFTAKNEKLKANTKYYGVLEVKAVSGVGTFYVTEQWGNQPQTQSKIAYNLNNITNGSKYKFNFTTLEDFTDCICMFRTFLKLDAGQSGSITFRLSVFESDPDLDTFEYEKYGAMPSPNYPSNVETVGNNVNEFDNNTEITDKFINNSGIEASGLNNEKFLKQILIPNSNKYTMSFKEKVGNAYVRFSYYNEETFISREVSQTNSYTFTVPEGTTKIDIRTDTETYYFTELKIEQGTKATPYSKYGQGNVKIDISNKQLFNIRDLIAGMGTLNLDEDDFVRVTFDNSTGTSTKYYNIYTNASKLIKSNTKYYLVLEIKEVSGTGILYSHSAGTDWVAQFVGQKSYNFDDIKNENIIIEEITSFENLNSSTVMLRTFLAFKAGQSGSITFRMSVLEQKPDINTFQYIKYQLQSKILPIQEKMLEGDYIEDVEHHGWGKYVFTGDENITTFSSANSRIRYVYSGLQNNIKKPAISTELIGLLCNYYKEVTALNTYNNVEGISVDENGQLIFKNEIDITVEQFKVWLAEQYTAGTPVTVYYKLATPIDLELTEEQEEAKEGLNTYKNITNISVDNELATLDVEYTAETTEKITNEGNIYSEPIIRLEKTQTEAVEVTINDIRFKYNFNNEEYVEIDCEKKTVEYEGLNRNRQIEIGYDFPKLKTGKNEILMHSGDCVIKVLRKDRWL